MDEKERLWCLDVTERLIALPSAALFLAPVSNKEKGMKNYYVKVRNPVDLGGIKGKLLTKEYATFKEWKSDVKMIWKNAERFYGKKSMKTALAFELHKRFRKMCEERPISLKAWCETFRTATNKLELLTTKTIPNSVLRHSPTCIQIPEVPETPNSVISKIVEASKELANRDDARRMMRLVLKFHPEMSLTSKDMRIDIDTLSPIAIWSLDRYIRTKFEEMGKEY
jgi:hypothetical protein